MKIKAIRAFYLKSRLVSPGEIIELKPATAQWLMERGAVEALPSKQNHSQRTEASD